jgi:hypothetical protein
MIRFDFTSCVDRIVCVFYVSVGIYTHRLHVCQIHDGVQVLHLQHRHVFRRLNMKYMLVIL